ncbi:MAG TPA: hypothetical protein DCM87_02580 [Planctomycetes bacterium]|nr:hypothetical protein [Planctomycetota bacterium]
MDDWERTRLTDAELEEFFDALFPTGFAGPDVLADIAPESWEKTPLCACFHPSPEQVFEEVRWARRRIEELTRSRRERAPQNPELAPSPEPTLEGIRAEWKDTPVNAAEEVAELVGKCLWDVFSDNHEVITADGRVADIGSFRGAGAFIAEYLSGPSRDRWSMDYCRFYLGTIWIRARADLTPVYRMIFRRLKALGADWEYHFPALGVVDLAPLKEAIEKPEGPEDYSPSEAFAKEQEERERQEELERFRAELAESNAQARREAMDCPPPPTVRAYQEVYGGDPRGWPPA